MLQSVLTRLLKELRDPELPVFLSCVLDGFEYEFSLGGKKKGEVAGWLSVWSWLADRFDDLN